MNRRLLLILLIISFSLTSIKMGAVPPHLVWIFDVMQGIGTGIMLALAAYRNPDGTSARQPYVRRDEINETRNYHG